jgi:ABC-2 type transport system permease protein
MSSVATSASSSRPRAGVVRPFVALVRRDFQVRRSYRVAFALDLVLGFLNLLIYYFISRTFADVGTADLGGAPSYFAYALVGIVLGVIVAAATMETASVLRQEQLTGTLEALATQPVNAMQLSLGLAVLPIVFATLRVTFYLLVAAVWLHIDVARASWGGLAAIFVATALAMLAIGVTSCAVVLVVKRGDALVGMVIFGMGILSGAVFPVSVLPAWLGAIGELLPMRFAFDGARSAIFEGRGWSGDVAFLLVFSAVVLPMSLLLFREALALARRSGSLGQY